MSERYYYATVFEYAAMYKNTERLSKERAKAIGRLAAALSRERGIPIGKAPNKYYGTINAYRNDILSDCFFSATSTINSNNHGKGNNHQSIGNDGRTIEKNSQQECLFS